MSLVRRPLSRVVTGAQARTGTETAAATDAVTVTIQRFRAPIDVAPATDVATRTSVRSRTSAETTALSDQTARTSARSRTAADTAAATDTALGNRIPVGASRTASDSAPAADGTATGHTYYLYRTGFDPPNPVTDVAVRDRLSVRTPVDSAPATDLAGGSSLHPRFIGDSTPGHSDAATRSQIAGRAVSESIGGVDSATRPVLYRRTASDSAPAADATVVPSLRALSRSATDSANSVAGQVNNFIDTAVWASAMLREVTDLAYERDNLIERLAAPSRSLSQPLSHPVFALRAKDGLVDSITAVAFHPRTASDAAGGSDDLADKAPVQKIRDAYEGRATGADLTRSLLLWRTWAENIDGSDTLESVVLKYAQPVLPATGFGDSPAVQSARQFYRTGDDSAYALDAPVPPGTHVRRTVDSAPATDSAQARVLRITRPQTAPTGFGDSPAALAGRYARSLAETAPATETGQAVRSALRSAADVAGGSAETTIATVNRLRTATDAAPAVEAAPLDSLARHPRSGAESAPATDALTVLRALRRTGTDTAPAVLVSQEVARLARALTDDAPAADSPSITSRHARTATDSVLALTDRAERFHGPSRLTTDSAPAADGTTALGRVGSRARTGADTAPADDGLYAPRNVVIARNGAETTSVLDNPSRLQRFPREAEDAALGFDLIDTTKTQGRALDEAVSGIDTLTHQVLMPRLAEESVHGSDAVVRTAPKFRTASDTAELVFVDNITRFHDAATRFLLAPRQVGESVGGTDTLDHDSRVTRRIFDASGPVTDTADRSGTYARWSAEDISLPAGVVEQAEVISGNARSAFDQVHAFETLTYSKTTGLMRTSVDQAAAADAASAARRASAALTDSAPAADAVTRTPSRGRLAVEVGRFAESTGRYVRAWRTPSDALSLSEQAQAARANFARVLDQARASDVATRSGGVYHRDGQDQAPATDQGTGVHHYDLFGVEILPVVSDAATKRLRAVRGLAESAPAVDSLASLWRRIRTGVDQARAADAATRSMVMARTLVQSVRGLDSASGSHVLAWRTGADSAAATDALVHVRTRVRQGLEVVGGTEAVSRFVFALRRAFEVVRSRGDFIDVDRLGLRSVHDSAPAEDEVTSIRQALAFGQDSAPALDDLQAATRRSARGLDAARARDAARRSFTGRRLGPEQALAVDQSAHLLAQVRAVLEALITTDGLVESERPRPVIGAPVVRILSVSRGKISAVDGYNSARLVFEFDQPVDAWSVRVGSTSAFDGTEVACWYPSEPGFGLAPFGTSAFGSPAETVQWGTSEIFDVSLDVGPNDVAVYGRSLRGQWSAPDAAPALSAAL